MSILAFVRCGASVSRAVPLFLAVLASAQDPVSDHLRVGVRARSGGADRLTPLRYIGGFETKTMIYETLVRRGEDGRIGPGLASRFSVDENGTTFRFELRDGATFHDGTPVTAAAVKVHFQRWAGLPEHNWLPVNRLIAGVEVESERVFRVDLTEPYSLLSDLVAINPCAVVGPSARDWEGEFRRPMGTGPFRFTRSLDDGKRWILTAAAGSPTLEVSFYPRGRDDTPIDDLIAGKIDAFVGGWDEDLPAQRLDALAADARFAVQTARGSSVVYLTFQSEDGPTADLAVRQRIAASIDRDALIARVEGGRAEPCTTWAAPAITFWPRGPASLPRTPPTDAATPGLAAADGTAKVALKIAAGRGRGRAARVADAVAEQLRAAGFAVEVLAAPSRSPESPVRAVTEEPTVTPQTTESGDVRARANRAVRRRAETADVRVEITHGAPYDPHQSLIARFASIPAANEDEPRPRRSVDPELAALVAEAMHTPSEEQCMPIYTRIQDRMDRQALVVPLFAPHRVAIRSSSVSGIQLGSDVYHVDLTGLHRTESPATDAVRR